MSKLVVILGPTASGKTSLATNLAYHFQGEIISADSRQIYKGMDIGTGKDLNEYVFKNKNIPYHLIDILKPSENYSVYTFKKDFSNIYDSLIDRKSLPILCGGTGLYIESILLNYQMVNIPPNDDFRVKLEKQTLNNLIHEIQQTDNIIYDSEYHITKRRIIRSLEIHKYKNDKDITNNIDCNHIKPIVFGINIERENILKKIKIRLENRLNDGMIEEVKELINSGLTLERLKYFGLEYKFIGEYLYDNISFSDMKEKLNFAINRFSKKQMTFFRRMEKRGIKIHWVKLSEIKLINNKINTYLNEL